MLSGVDLHVPPGQTLALVGATELLSSHRADLATLEAALLEHETLERAELQALLPLQTASVAAPADVRIQHFPQQ